MAYGVSVKTKFFCVLLTYTTMVVSLGAFAMYDTSLLLSAQEPANTKEWQIQANRLREEGKSLDAIALYNKLIVQQQQEHQHLPMIEALTGRLLCWKHLFYQTEDKIYAIFVRKEAEAMLEIAKAYGITEKVHLLHYLLAKAAQLQKDDLAAELDFQRAVELYPVDNAEKGDWMAHLGAAMYANGKKAEGQKVLLQGVQKIQAHQSDLDPFFYNVWVSGAYLRLAKLLYPDNPQESKRYLELAQEIVDSDDRLVIRKGQLEAFIKAINN